MEQYSLVLDIDDDGVRRLSESGVRLIVAKPSGNNKPTVAWLAVEPARGTTIVWDDRYGLYAAHVPVRDGAQIAIVAAVYPAADGMIYPFAGAAFGDPVVQGRIPLRHYDVRNDEQGAVTFGLLQSAAIDGRTIRAPLNAVVLPPGFIADFMAVTTVYVWAQAGVAGGSIISQVPPRAMVVAFDAANRVRRYRYDDRTGMFTAKDDDT